MPPPQPGSTVAIVLAAGEGSRLGGGVPKAFLEIEGTPLVVHAVRAAVGSGLVDLIVVAVPAGFDGRAEELLGGMSTPVAVVEGGPSRHASVGLGLSAAPVDAGVVVCHDAARPFTRPELFAAVVKALD